MALVGNILLGTGAAPGISSIASAYAESAASSRIPWGALEYSGQTITAISGSAIGGQGGGGGDTSQCMPKSASADFYSTSNPSGFLTAHQSLSGYVPNSAISSQSSVWNTVTGKVNASDISAQSAAWNTVSEMVPKSAISAQSATWNTVTAKADATAVHTYTGVSPVVVNNTTDQISLSASSIHLDTSLRSYVSGTSGFIGMAYPMQFVSSSSQATGSNILYVVLGG